MVSISLLWSQESGNATDANGGGSGNPDAGGGSGGESGETPGPSNYFLLESFMIEESSFENFSLFGISDKYGVNRHWATVILPLPNGEFIGNQA